MGMYYDELECTPSFLTLTLSSPCGASTPLPTLLGGGGGEGLNQIRRRGPVAFFLYFYQRDCDESRLCICRMKVNM